MHPVIFQEGDTALMAACAGGHAEVVKALLGAEPRANIESTDNVGVLSVLALALLSLCLSSN